MVKIRIDGDTKDFEQKLNGLGETGEKALKGIKVAAAAIGAALVAAGAYAFGVGKDFEAGMSGVQAVLQTSEEEMERLSNLAKEMGATTVYSATQAAEALQYIAQAGYDAAGATELLPDVLNLAATDAMDLGVAAQYVTNGLAIFGDAAGGAAHYSDLLATTAAAADGSVSDMAEAFMVAGGQAMLAGLDMDELATAVGVLANNGIKGSEGGTHLRNALKNLYTPTTDAAQAMDELNIQTRNADGSLVGMQDVLLQLNAQLSGLDDAARLDYMGRIFDTRTLAAANALINSSTDAWDELAVAMDGAEGAAARMAEIKLDNLEGDITLLTSAAEGLGIQIYEAFGESARGTVQGLTSSVEILMGAFDSPEAREAITAIGEALAIIVDVISGTLATVLPVVVQVFGNFASLLKALEPTIKAVSTAVTTLVNGALKVLGSVVQGVADNIELFIPIVATAVTAMVAYNAVHSKTSKSIAQFVTEIIKTRTAMMANQTLIMGEVKAHGLLTAAMSNEARARALKTAATKAGMSIDAADNLVTAAGTVATQAETLALMASTGALSLKTIATGVLSGSITVATAIQLAWNAAMAANPVGAILVVVVALTAALGGLVYWLSRDSEEMAILKEESAALVEETRKLREEYDSAQASFEDEAAAMNTNAAAAVNLTGKLSDLLANTSRTAAEEEQLASIVSDLNELVPSLGLEYNKYTKQLNMTEDAILAVIEAERERGQAQLRMDRALELEKDLLVMQERRNELTEKEAALKEQIDNMGPFTAAWKMSEAQESLIAVREEMAGLDEDIASATTNVGLYREESAELITQQQAEAEAFATSDENLTALAEKYGTTAEAIRAATDGSAESIQAWADAQDAALEEMQARAEESLSNIVAAYYDSNNKIDLSNAQSLQNRIENISENQRLSQEYAANLAAIGEQVGTELDAGLLAELQRGDEEAMALAQQMVNSLDAGDDQWSTLNELYANDVDGVLTTITDSWTFSETNPADTMIDDLVASIEAGSATLDTASETLVTAAVTAANTQMTAQKTTLSDIGKMLVSGIAAGVTEGQSVLTTAVQGVIAAAAAAAKEAAEVNSPSRLFKREVGRWIPAGIAEGIEEGTPGVEDAVKAQAAAVLAAYDGIDTDISVDSLAEQMTGMFDGVPDEFFTMGETSGEQFIAGFSKAAFGYFALFENMMMGNVMMTAAVPAGSGVAGGDVNINFYEPVESPDTVTRAVTDVFQFGLAGERN